jgi:hypothetical protein
MLMKSPAASITAGNVMIVFQKHAPVGSGRMVAELVGPGAKMQE